MPVRAPLFRKRLSSQGYGYDANGAAGWGFTVVFVAVLLATVIPAALVARGPSWPVCVPLVIVALAEVMSFIWFAKRESERA